MDKKEYAPIIAGAGNGIIQTITGHPIDTLKVLTQQSNKIVWYRPFNELYRGITYPLLSKTFTYGLRFGLGDYFHKKTNNWFISGALGSIVASPIVSILDFYKINRQVGNKLTIYQNPFKGYVPFLLRDSLGMGIYLSLYKKMYEYSDNAFWSGGLAGITCWFIIFPIDTIQSRIKSGLASNIKDAIKLGKLHQGNFFAISKAFMINGIGLYTYQSILNQLK